MKIAYLINEYPMASQTFIRREIAALEQHGLEVSRFALREGGDELVDAADLRELSLTRYTNERGVVGLVCALVLSLVKNPMRFIATLHMSIKLMGCSDRSMLHHLAYLAEACVLQKWLRQKKIQHVHVHFATNSAEVALLSYLLGGPAYSFMVHGPIDFDRAIGLSLDLKAQHAAFITTISDYAKSQIFRWIEFDNWHKVHIVRCGLDGSYFEDTICSLPEERCLVSIGRLCEQKGQMILIDAAAKLLEELEDFQLTIIGDGEFRSTLEEAIEAKGLTRYVRLVGWLDNVAVKNQIQQSRGLVMASFAEGLPVVIIESLALRRPVISTWIAGVPELVSHGESGWLVPPGNSDQLATAMKELLMSPVELLEEMAQRGQSLARANHSVSTEAEKLRELILSVPR